MDVLSQQEVEEELATLHGWDLTPEGIRKQLKVDSFMSGIRLVNRVAEIAEAANHHPDMLVTYDTVTFTLVTHDAGGLTRKDFEMASRIDEAARGKK